MRDRHTVRIVSHPQRGEQQHQFEVSQVVTSHSLPSAVESLRRKANQRPQAFLKF